MENLQSLNNPNCGELERLAAAAASMDYTDSLGATQIHDPKIQDSQPPAIQSSEEQVPIAHSSRTTLTAIPHVISYIDPYQIPKGHHLIPVRTYEPSQSYLPDQQQTLQPSPNSRVIMVTADDNHSTSNIQFARPATHFTLNEIYQNENNDGNCIQPSSYSQILSSTNSQILHYESENTEVELSQESLPKFTSNSARDEGTAGNKQKKTLKPKTNVKNITDESEGSQATNDDEEKEFLSCNQCKAVLESEAVFKQHQAEHNMPKRNGLALELKIEIIKRINAGERKADMADEYGVNTSTIKSIMKKADNYLTCWKKGMFNPDSKRLKGPKREDVEEALYSWYKQAIGNDTPVSGPILCAKAQDFAKKLGHKDFKPTHGWLDRFKKRKKIVFGRSSSKRRREDKMQECLTSILPQMLIDYESTDIFAVELIGLCYKALPSDVDTLKGSKCAGGVKSKERMSLVLCTNMTGSEKFPLLVVGRSQKNFVTKNAKCLPVHYITDKYAWLTTEIISSWLLDMDSWFVQQGRKVILLAPPSPIYSHPPKLRALKFVVLPHGYPSPLRQAVVPYFKKYYRKKFLEEIMVQASREKQPFVPQFSILASLQILSSAWQSISDNVIVTSFQRSGLTKYGVWGMVVPTDNADFAGVQELFLNAAHILADLPSPETTFDAFVHFDDEVQVCNLMGDDDILAKVKGVLEEEENTDDESNACNQDKTDTERPSFAEVENALGILRRYIQYQEGAQEMFRVLAQLEYFIYKNVSDAPISNHMIH